MATTLSEATAAQSAALTQAYKGQQNRDAARLAALVALYYQHKVDFESPASVEAWLNLMVPRIIGASDTGANRAAAFFDAMRKLEVPGAPSYSPTPALGMVDAGVRKSLLTVGPYADTNKRIQIDRLNVPDQQKQALLARSRENTITNVAAAVVRHAQTGSRQTIYSNSEKDKVALGWVRVTREKPCAFCAMLASRGIQYRSFRETSFLASDARFTGDGNAKVHDNCGCSLKAVYAQNDPILANNAVFEDLWSRWGAGGGNAALRFRRGYDHWAETGEYMSFDQANKDLTAA